MHIYTYMSVCTHIYMHTLIHLIKQIAHAHNEHVMFFPFEASKICDASVLFMCFGLDEGLAGLTCQGGASLSGESASSQSSSHQTDNCRHADFKEPFPTKRNLIICLSIALSAYLVLFTPW